MTFPTKDTFTFDFTAQSDYPNWTPLQTKQNMNARGEELRLALNAVVNLLNSVTDGNSGANNVAITPIAEIGEQADVQSIVEEIVTRLKVVEDYKTSLATASGAASVGAVAPSGLSGTTVQSILNALKSAIDSTALGQIPDGSLLDVKFSDAEGQLKDTVGKLINAINDLAGSGRTDETVKENADNITSLQQDLSNYQGNLSSLEIGKGASLVGINDAGNILTATNVEGALQELASRPQKDIDNGRYQVDYGFLDATLSDLVVSSDSASLRSGSSATTGFNTPSNNGGQTNDMDGILFTPSVTITKITVVKSSSCNATSARLQRKSDFYTIADVAFSGNNAVFTNLSLQPGVEYVLGAIGSAYTLMYSTGESYPYITPLHTVKCGWAGSEQFNSVYNFVSFMTESSNAISGTATKIISPTAPLKGYGSVKVTASQLNASNSATVTVKSSSDAQLIAPVTLVNGDNLVDISAISVSSNPSVKVILTENRNTVSDQTPLLSKPSVTWEGAGLGSIITWEKITEVKLSTSTGQIDFTVPSTYNRLQLRFSILSTASSTDLYLRFNDDKSSTYLYGYEIIDQSSASISNGGSSTQYIWLPGAMAGNPFYHFSHGVIDIFSPSSADSLYKTLKADYMTRVTGSSYPTRALVVGTWNSTAQINKISLVSSSASSLMMYKSTFSLWGVK